MPAAAVGGLRVRGGRLRGQTRVHNQVGRADRRGQRERRQEAPGKHADHETGE